MHVFDQLTFLDSLIVVLGMYVSYAMVGSILFSLIGTPWEFSKRNTHVFLRELLRVVIGFIVATTAVYFTVEYA